MTDKMLKERTGTDGCEVGADRLYFERGSSWHL